MPMCGESQKWVIKTVYVDERTSPLLQTRHMMSTEKKNLKGRLQKKKKTKVFDHQIPQKLATDVIWESFDEQ